MDTEPTAALIIEDKTYQFAGDRAEIRAFIKELQRQLPIRRYPLTLRIYKIAAYAIGDSGVRGIRQADREAAVALRKTDGYRTWDDFVDELAANDLIAAKVDAYVRFRPRRLGTRPPWFPAINAARPPGAGLAIRHIVPSHLLGYAAEHLPRGEVTKEAVERLETRCEEAYLAFQATVEIAVKLKREPVPASEWKRKRRVWELLYNHPGNLWVGDSYANTVIGQMQGVVQSVIRSLKETTKPSQPMTPSRPGELLREAMPPSLSKVQPDSTAHNLREEIVSVLASYITNAINEDEPEIDDITEFFQDVAANLDLDIPALVDWNDVVVWQTRFETKPTKMDDMYAFLGTNFKDSLLHRASSATRNI